MSQKPVVVPIERYAVLIGAYGSRDPGRAPSQNIQIFHSPPDHDLRTILTSSSEAVGEGPINRSGERESG